MRQKVEGIIIKSMPYGETNKILTIMTKQKGKIGVIAHGANKPKSKLTACSHLFTYGEFLIQQRKGLGVLHQGDVTESMRYIREDIDKTAYAAPIIELADKAIEEGSGSPFLYNLLYKTLKFINEGKDPEIMMYMYQLKILDLLGLKPFLDGCQSCRNTKGHFVFSVSKAGFLCNQCFREDPYYIKISPSTLKLLRALYYVDIDLLGNVKVKKETKEELNKVISHYYEEYSGIYLKSLKFLKQMDALSSIQ